MSYPKDMQDIQDEIYEWQSETFPNATLDSILEHMTRELAELKGAIKEGQPIDDIASEIADVQLLLFHLASKLALNIESQTMHKFITNKSRKWGKADAQGVVEHIEEEQK